MDIYLDSVWSFKNQLYCECVCIVPITESLFAGYSTTVHVNLFFSTFDSDSACRLVNKMKSGRQMQTAVEQMENTVFKNGIILK